jgi:protein disulfide-isomerase-like protein
MFSLLFLFTLVVADTPPTVVPLDSMTAVQAFVTAEPATIIKFYAPWCGHCKRMVPAYEDAARKLTGEARLGEVDCTQHKLVYGTFGVRGYPTLKVFTGSIESAQPYTGKRETDDFIAVIRAAIGKEEDGREEL